jgi:hypothetical protein
LAISKQSVVLTNAGGGTFNLAVGPETFTFSQEQVRTLWDGRRDLDHLLFQILITLAQAGVNPKTATFQQIKTAVEAQTYWWGS